MILMGIGLTQRGAGSKDFHDLIRVGYQFGIFGWCRLFFSSYLPYQYQRKTWLVHFGIKILVGTPFFPKKGSIGPL
jgi:hypothetical protein